VLRGLDTCCPRTKVKAMIGIFLISFFSTAETPKAEFAAIARQWVNNAREEGWYVDSVDAWVFERTMQEFGAYLDHNFGERRRDKIFSRIRTPYDVSDALDKVVHRRFGSYFWLEAQSGGGSEWLTYDTEHFRLFYHPKSMAQKDIRLIAAVAEQSFEDITAILSPDSGTRARFSRILSYDGVSLRYTKGKIPLRLYAKRSDLAGAEQASGGQTGFRPVWFKDSVGYNLWIDIIYPGPPGLFGLPHEIAHALALIYLSNEQLLAELLSSGEPVPSNLLREAVLTDDILRLEGWAYMVQYNHTAYVRLGLWRESAEIMASMNDAYGFPDAYDLLRGETTSSFAERILDEFGLSRVLGSGETVRFLFAAADLIRYLHETYGSEKLAEFLTTREPPLDAVFSVYGLTPYALEQEWKNNVLDQ
jgi:hypothetical protein